MADLFCTAFCSVSELRYKVCLEFLMTLEDRISLAEPSLENETGRESAEEIIRRCMMENNSALCINADRALLFSKFLSEEWDLDYLAIFLHHRQVLQATLGVNLKEIVTSRVVTGVTSGAEVLKTLASDDDSLGMSQAVTLLKNAPATVALPTSVRLVADYTFSESPLVAVHNERLLYLVQQLSPSSTPEARAYLCARVHKRVRLKKAETVKRIAKPVMNTSTLEMDFAASQTQLAQAAAAGADTEEIDGCIMVDGMPVVPIYLILVILMEEWRLIPPEAKQSISEVGKASEASLKELNALYDNNCELMQTLVRRGLELEAEFRACEGTLNQQEKQCRRLERRWNDNVATADELMQLQEIRVIVTETKTVKMAMEAKLKSHTSQVKKLQAKIDGLWSTALLNGIDVPNNDMVTTVKKTKGKKGPPEKLAAAPFDKKRWRVDVQELVAKALTQNSENADLKQQARDAVLISTGGEVVQASPEKKESAAAKRKRMFKEHEEERARSKAAREAKRAPPPIPKVVRKRRPKVADQSQPETTDESVGEDELPPPLPALQETVVIAPPLPVLKEPIVEEDLGAIYPLMPNELEEANMRRAQHLFALEAEVAGLGGVGYREALDMGLVPTRDTEEAARAEVERLRFEAEEAERVRVAEELRVAREAEEAERARLAFLKTEQNAHARRIHDLAVTFHNIVRAVVTAGVMDVAGAACVEAVGAEASEIVMSCLERSFEVNRRWRRDPESPPFLVPSEQMACSTSLQREINSAIALVWHDNIQQCVGRLTDVVLTLVLQDEQQRQQAYDGEETLSFSEEVVGKRYGDAVRIEAAVLLRDGLKGAIEAVSPTIAERTVAAYDIRLERLYQIQDITVEDLQVDISTVLDSAVENADAGVVVSTQNMLIARENARIAEYNRAVGREVFDVLFDVIERIELADREAVERELKIDACASLVVTATTTLILEDEFVVGVLRDQSSRVLMELYHAMHPWEALDEDPAAFVDEEVLGEVEELFIIQQMQQHSFLKKHCVAMWKDYVAKQKLARVFCDLQMKKRSFRAFRDNHDLFQLRRRSAVVLQQFFIHMFRDRRRRRLHAEHLAACHRRADAHQKVVLLRRRNVALRFFVYRLRTQQKFHSVIFNLTERRFIKTYYTWLHHYKGHKKERLERETRQNAAALQIECAARILLARRRLFMKQMQLRLIMGVKVMLALQKVRARQKYIERFGEYFNCVVTWKERRLHKQQWRKWKRNFGFRTGLRIFRRWYIRRRLKSRFRVWKRQVNILGNVRHRKAAVVQSALRMYITQKYVLNYFSWRRNLLKLQGAYRRRVARKYFFNVLPLFRGAIMIQKHFRGHYLRTHMTQCRIKQIHYSAAHNNYDKLLYYVEKYPELLSELDEDGNTPLHNAAKNASRRTLKLLLRAEVDPNAVNFAGLTPLHLIICSSAVNRDDLTLYMLEHGFDDEQLTPDGKSCLLLACENGRVPIVKELLETLSGLDFPNTPDHSGTTCLQTACSQGYYAIVKLLIDHGADVNAVGYNGTVPLHDCVASSDVRIAELLISHGAYVKVHEPNVGQSPLMYACRHGDTDIARLYILQGADVSGPDYYGYTCAHHSTVSNNLDLYHALREADADFDGLDLEGNSSLHIAVQFNSIEYVKALLEGGAHPSHQNKRGDQPLHLAAQYNFVKCMAVLCSYDEHVGRVNNSHQTPLGVAKFYCSKEAAAFLEAKYVRNEREGDRNAEGDLWWDREIDALALEGWKVNVSDRGDRLYVNINTGEVRETPPAFALKDVETALLGNEWRLRQNVQLVQEEDKITKHSYEREYQAFAAEVAIDNRIYRMANRIIKTARMKLAKKELGRLRAAARRMVIFTRFFKENYPNFHKNCCIRRGVFARRIQAAFRGFKLRKRYREFLYDMVHYDHQCRTLARLVHRFWRFYKCNYLRRVSKHLTTQPRTVDDWAVVVAEARRPIRIVGVYEVYPYKKNVDIFFYRHKLNGICTLIKPKILEVIDNQDYIDICQIKARGYTTKQNDLTITLQKLWRGYYTRSYYRHVETAMKISMTAELDYMRNPESDKHLYNYTLHCHVVLRDYDKARRLYMECLNRMAYRGPDFAFILYAYAIFAFVTQDLDYVDVQMLIARGKKAEETREILLRKKNKELESAAIANGTFQYGKVFNLAKIGFFRFSANSDSCGPSWHNYAACTFLIYNDYKTSFESYLNAFKYDAANKGMKHNFDIMMTHFFGSDSDVLAEKVRSRMQYLAARDDEARNVRARKLQLAKERAVAATKIQRWFRARQSRLGFAKFMKRLWEHTIPPAEQDAAISKPTHSKPPTGLNSAAGSVAGTTANSVANSRAGTSASTSKPPRTIGSSNGNRSVGSASGTGRKSATSPAMSSIGSVTSSRNRRDSNSSASNSVGSTPRSRTTPEKAKRSTPGKKTRRK